MKRIIVIFLSLLVIGGSLFAKTNVVAHRGYWKKDGSAHNSISSLVNAQILGVYGSELDVHLTADGVVVVYHDDSIKGHNISRSDFAEIKDMTLKNGETLPTFEAYLTQAQKNLKTKLIIEIKPKKDSVLENKTVKAVFQLVKKHHLERNVEYISFSMNICKELVRIKVGAPVAYLAYRDFVCSPKELKEIGLSGFDYHYALLQKNPEWIAEAKSLGLTSNAWTVNSAEVMKNLVDLGIDYITTDEPETLMEIISR